MSHNDLSVSVINRIAESSRVRKRYAVNVTPVLAWKDRENCHGLRPTAAAIVDRWTVSA